MEPTAPWRVLETQAPLEQPASAAPQSPGSVPWPAVAAFALAAVLAVAAFVAASGSTSTSLAIDGQVDDLGAARSVEPSSAIADAKILVEVGGAVLSPGVYALPAGARISDAIGAAGGFGPRVDTERADRQLNLAAVLSDGTEIHVPSRDDAPDTTSAAMPTDTVADNTGGDLVDLNRATAAELEALPGIGPATAAKVIAARDEQRFVSVDELRSRKVLGAATFEKVRELVTTGP